MYPNRTPHTISTLQPTFTAMSIEDSWAQETSAVRAIQTRGHDDPMPAIAKTVIDTWQTVSHIVQCLTTPPQLQRTLEFPFILCTPSASTSCQHVEWMGGYVRRQWWRRRRWQRLGLPL